jgi:hypothetical protein
MNTLDDEIPAQARFIMALITLGHFSCTTPLKSAGTWTIIFIVVIVMEDDMHGQRPW